MYQRLFVSVVFVGLLHSIANAGGLPEAAFVDGRWSGGIETGPNSLYDKECWASATFDDGTIFTLAKRGDGTWHLRLSNPDWQLPPSRRYDMTALVDFYPRLRIAAEATSRTSLDIANLEQVALLGIIENGHTIDLTSDGFNEKYELEGSAKIIAKIRTCSPNSWPMK